MCSSDLETKRRFARCIGVGAHIQRQAQALGILIHELRHRRHQRFLHALVGGRLLPGQPDERVEKSLMAPVALFMYQDAKGLRLTLYVRTNADASRETAFRFAQEKNIGVFYWVDQKLGYALSGEADKNELLRVANTVYKQLNP